MFPYIVYLQTDMYQYINHCLFHQIQFTDGVLKDVRVVVVVAELSSICDV